MLKYVFKRILAMIPVLFIISIVIFGTVKAMPGDEVTAYFGAGSKVTQEQRDHVRELLGLDKSLPEQYVRWVGRMCTGDLVLLLKNQLELLLVTMYGIHSI